MEKTINFVYDFNDLLKSENSDLQFIKKEIIELNNDFFEDSLLFNASKNTNLIYRVLPELNQEMFIKLNSFDTYSKRIKSLSDNGYHLVFIKLQSEIFKTNLEMIDSKLPEILSYWLLNRYLSCTNTLVELTNYLTRTNPCNFNIELNPNYYSRKIKDMLVDMALGMQAGKIWNGTFNVTGGYIAVKKDGELLCYHIYNKNEFQEYLITHTKIDFPDSSPNRCDYGRILTSDEVDEIDGQFIKLNFQIRFK
ncbi:MAG: hpaIIR [Ignavibacteria bacterium]|nr:hpaIIR [Ignavibacteria bacterium]